jgi:hypothetical protein
MKMKLLLLLFIIPASAWSQMVHKDQYEFGYKGKVKQIVKKTYSCEEKDCELLDFAEEAISTYVYFYNKEGNIDSVVAGRYAKTSRFMLTTKYQFTNSRKSGWQTIAQTGARYVHAVTTWITDREYVEKVYTPDEQLQMELRYWLNDSFRLVKVQSTMFDELKPMQESVQKFEFDEAGNIKNYTTIESSGLEVFAQYKYLEKDAMGNPLKILIDKGKDVGKSVIVLTFTYYD